MVLLTHLVMLSKEAQAAAAAMAQESSLPLETVIEAAIFQYRDFRRNLPSHEPEVIRVVMTAADNVRPFPALHDPDVDA